MITVIDNLPVWTAPELLRLLKLEERAGSVRMELRHPDGKDVITAEGFEPTRVDEQKIALLAPHATLYEQSSPDDSRGLRLPEVLEQIVRCTNPRCITRAEEVPHKIKVGTRETYQCHYCRHRFSQKELEFL